MTWEQISSQSNGPGRKIRPTIANDRPNLPSSVNHSSATVGRSVFHSVDPSGSSFPPEASRHKQVITQTRKSAADPSGRRHNAELWKVARKNTILFTALAGGRTNGRTDGRTGSALVDRSPGRPRSATAGWLQQSVSRPDGRSSCLLAVIMLRCSAIKHNMQVTYTGRFIWDMRAFF